MTELVDKQDSDIEHPGGCGNVLFGDSCGDVEINVQYEKDFERREAMQDRQKNECKV